MADLIPVFDDVPVTSDAELNAVLVEIYQTNDDPQEAVWTAVRHFGVTPPFDSKRFPQPFILIGHEGEEQVCWPDTRPPGLAHEK